MKTLLIVSEAVIAVLVIFVIVILVIGYCLPQSHIASRSIKLNRSLNDVYVTVRDFSASPKWRSDLQSVEMLETQNGHVRFHENGSNGNIIYELLEDVPNRRIVTQIVDRELGYSGSWTYLFLPDSDGVILTITENGDVSNPMFRFISRYVFGHTATIDAYLKR